MTAARVRDWATVDYYAVLGVPRSATDEDVARAFRALAKERHPDAALDDPDAAEDCKEIAAAYAVLGDEDTRRDYDRVRAEVAAPTRAPTATPGLAPRRSHGVDPPAPRKPWSRRKAWTVIVSGIL